MRCQEAREQLAIYRELSKAEHDRLQQHLSGCLTCAATQAAYQAQNNLLSALPAISPSAGLAAAVRGRTVGQHRSVRRFSWGWAAAALSLLLLFLGVVGGAVSIAADALPGDALYAVKRVTEQVRLVLTLDPAARDRYQHQLAETRREEVREIVRLERQARVQFQGYLEAVADDVWVVDGLTVRVDSAAWAGAPPQGSVIFIEAQAAGGKLEAHRVQMRQPAPPPIATPAVSPVLSPSPTLSPTPAGSPTRTRRPLATQPADTRPSPEPRRTRQSGVGPQPSTTPGASGPGSQSSATPGASSPGPHPTQSPNRGDGIGSADAPTPDSGPGPNPTQSPRHGNSPGPTHTPTTGSAPTIIPEAGPKGTPSAEPPKGPLKEHRGPGK